MTTSNDSTIPLKRCAKGVECAHSNGCWQPATLEYFHRHKRNGLQSRCKDCMREYSRQQRIANPERVSEQGRRWRVANPERLRNLSRQWRAKNPEKERERSRKRRAADPEKARKTSRQWRKANPEKAYEINRRWNQRNLDKKRANEQRRLARKRALLATFTAEQWQDCLNYWHGVCVYCGSQQSLFHSLEQDHFTPVVLGGVYTATNIVPACKSCNSSKNDTPADEWVKRKFKRRAKKILADIAAYFESIKSHPYPDHAP